MDFSIAILTGGPSLERGISLNSARSLLDHLSSDSVHVKPFYFDPKKQAYQLAPGQLYSNTPADFDFKIGKIARSLSERQLVRELRACDLVFPAIHGSFGEDGELQLLLEQNGIPFVGSGSAACQKCFDKYEANQLIRTHGFFTKPSALLKIYKRDHQQIIANFFKTYSIDQAVVKPASGGSSIGVFRVSSPKEALEKVSLLFSKRMDTRVVIEPFVKGTEFTTIILQNRFNLPVAIIPTEIENDYRENQIFSYRRKYLPSRQVTFHCPPRFGDSILEKIRVQAEQLFSLFQMKDFARFDGWLLDDELWFCDFNPISGMEQNSFLFQQAARVGLGHRAVLQYIVRNSCHRQGITPPLFEYQSSECKQEVAVLFGGPTSERQVSLMSGTNIWLKLLRSKTYRPTPFVLGLENDVWRAPYALLLNHTVEEVMNCCIRAEVDESRLRQFEESARLRLALESKTPLEPYFAPQRMSLGNFLQGQKFIFLGLHGGEGEDGTLQAELERYGVRYNGSGVDASKLCMDKFETGQVLSGLECEDIIVARKKMLTMEDLSHFSPSKLESFWHTLRDDLESKSLIVKPFADGCSSGIVRLDSVDDLKAYVEFVNLGIARIPAGRFSGQTDEVEMPSKHPSKLLFEPFIETDKVRAVSGNLRVTKRTGWIEVTVGLLEINGRLHALNPSITVTDGAVLSVEEKFQGGTGVNITPPPITLLSEKACRNAKRQTELVAQQLGIAGYARIDLFVERSSGRVMVIEANTLPGLTASTVLFHQGLAETPSLTPLDFLEKIILAGERR